MLGVSTELLIILALLLVNGVLAMAEFAIVAARKGRLKQLADEGDPEARIALETAHEPTRFLSMVQFGITLIGILAGAFGGTTLAEQLSAQLAVFSALAPYAKPLAFAVVVIGITLASVVFGELVPKRLGLAFSESVAVFLVPRLNGLSRLVAPIVSMLAFLTEAVLKLFRLRPHREAAVSDEEVNILIEQGLSEGVFNKTEKEMVAGVLELDQLPVTSLMTPRPKIVFLNLDDPEDVNWRKIVASGHSYFPVYQGNRDQVLGMVAVKALWAHSAIGLTTSLKNLLVSPLVVPETMTAIQLLESFKKSGKHIALITDEFGAIQGLVTLIDVLEAIVGDLPTLGRRNSPEAKQREDGSWLIDATLTTGDLKTMLNLDRLPHEDETDFQTLGGFVVTHFGRIPQAGDYFDFGGWRFEVVDMDRHRVDKVLVAKTPTANAAIEKAAG